MVFRLIRPRIDAFIRALEVDPRRSGRDDHFQRRAHSDPQQPVRRHRNRERCCDGDDVVMCAARGEPVRVLVKLTDLDRRHAGIDDPVLSHAAFGVSGGLHRTIESHRAQGEVLRQRVEQIDRPLADDEKPATISTGLEGRCNRANVADGTSQYLIPSNSDQAAWLTVVGIRCCEHQYFEPTRDLLKAQIHEARRGRFTAGLIFNPPRQVSRCTHPYEVNRIQRRPPRSGRLDTTERNLLSIPREFLESTSYGQHRRRPKPGSR